MTVLEMTEKELHAQVVELCKLLGWQRFHTYRSTRSPAGYPDETLWKGPRLVFVELKTAKGKLSDAQRVTLKGLAATCAEVYVVRPADFDVFAAVLGPLTAAGVNARAALNAGLSAELG